MRRKEKGVMERTRKEGDGGNAGYYGKPHACGMLGLERLLQSWMA